MSDIRDICLVKIYYKGTQGPYKVRSVLILNIIDTKYTIVEITSIEPKDPSGYYDTFKEKIYGWEKYGLDKLSYIKCKNVHNIYGLRFITQIGRMDLDEFEHIVNKIIEANQS